MLRWYDLRRFHEPPDVSEQVLAAASCSSCRPLRRVDDASRVALPVAVALPAAATSSMPTHHRCLAGPAAQSPTIQRTSGPLVR